MNANVELAECCDTVSSLLDFQYIYYPFNLLFISAET